MVALCIDLLGIKYGHTLISVQEPLPPRGRSCQESRRSRGRRDQDETAISHPNGEDTAGSRMGRG